MTKDQTIESVGFLAAAIGTFMMLPQAIKAFTTHQVGDLSLVSIIMIVVQCVLWVIYGFFRTVPLRPVWMANTVAFFIGVALLTMKLMWS